VERVANSDRDRAIVKERERYRERERQREKAKERASEQWLELF